MYAVTVGGGISVGYVVDGLIFCFAVAIGAVSLKKCSLIIQFAVIAVSRLDMEAIVSVMVLYAVHPLGFKTIQKSLMARCLHI